MFRLHDRLSPRLSRQASANLCRTVMWPTGGLIISKSSELIRTRDVSQCVIWCVDELTTTHRKGALSFSILHFQLSSRKQFHVSTVKGSNPRAARHFQISISLDFIISLPTLVCCDRFANWHHSLNWSEPHEQYYEVDNIATSERSANKISKAKLPPTGIFLHFTCGLQLFWCDDLKLAVDVFRRIAEN